MVEETVAIRQVLRLTGLSGFRLSDSDADVAARNELVNALQRSARDIEHAGRIISRWLETSRFAPTPSDIYEFGRQTDREAKQEFWRCGECDGTSWRQVYQHIVWTTGNNKTVKEISVEEYDQLRPHVSGIVGQDIVQKAVVRCTFCKVGRMRAEAEITDRNEGSHA